MVVLASAETGGVGGFNIRIEGGVLGANGGGGDIGIGGGELGACRGGKSKMIGAGGVI